MSREVRRFAGHLGRASGLPVEFFDEGLTSWEAEERIRARGRSVHEARRSGDVDREAACALLRSWLQEGENRPPDS
jgi:putative Holliday junction resolvase